LGPRGCKLESKSRNVKIYAEVNKEKALKEKIDIV